MLCIKSAYSNEEIIKKSRFIAVLTPCNTELDIASHLQQLQVTYPTASHIAFAYRIKTSNGFISRFHDAGEPSGTAGKPIFHHLEGRDLINVALFVIRYFGGIKLGAGGLTRAYGNAAKQVIENATLSIYIEYIEQQLTLEYKQIPTLEHWLKKLDGIITEQVFSEKVTMTVQLPKENLSAFVELFPAEGDPNYFLSK